MSTGSLKTNEFTATVATRPRARRAATTPPAMSTCDITQPPKMSPCWLASAGIGTTRSAGSRPGRMAASWGMSAPAALISRSGRRPLRLVAQFATQDLADVGLRQFLAELDVSRHLIAGEVDAAVLQDVVGRQCFVLLH